LFDFLQRELTKAGLRRAPTIASNLAAIWTLLEEGEWNALLAHLETLRTYPTILKERAVIKYLLADKYPGLGQKQSRNFIQWIGVSRYEVPLDSRVLKKMREFGASFVPSGTALTDEVVYLFVQDCLQHVSRALDIYPCMLDACIFASFDVKDDAEGADDA
jgi:thermostable 8-oxoguanine DNA glycosylase